MELVKKIIRKGEELLARRNKKFNKEIVVNAEALENRVAVMENGQLEEFTIERTTEKQIVASIFKGKIRNLEPGDLLRTRGPIHDRRRRLRPRP